MKSPLAAALASALLLLSCGDQAQDSPPAPDKAQVAAALAKASRFFREQVSTEGGYHFQYTEDLSFGRSEQAEGPTQVTIQRAGTPRVGMAFLEVYDALGDRFYLEAAQAAAHALVRGQRCSGGWDYIIEFDAEKRKDHLFASDGPCEGRSLPGDGRDYTTLDDNVTQAAVRLMMRVDRALNFEDQAIHATTLSVLDSLMRAQYPNGAWPQRYFEYPDPKQFPALKASYPDAWPREWPHADYRHFYTFNDNSIADDIDLFLEAARIYGDARYLETARRGGDFILLAQMPDPQPAWAQQYDQEMHPVWARAFEPPSITGGESQSNILVLMALYRETAERKYLDAIRPALEYLNGSVLPDDPDAPERRKRSCPPGSKCLARFYELKTNRPLYITKGTMIRGQGLGTLRPDGYELVYDDSNTITHYGMWSRADRLDEIEAELALLEQADPASIKRSDKLHGLSPWQSIGEEEPPKPEGLAERAAQIMAEMDERGAWVQDGVAGRADQVMSVFAAEEMVVRIGDRTYPLHEDETVEVFRGAAPVVERMIVSETFARNIEALAAYWKSL